MIQQYRLLPQKEQISYDRLKLDIQKSIKEGSTYTPELLKEFGEWVERCTRIYPLYPSTVVRLWEEYVEGKNRIGHS